MINHTITLSAASLQIKELSYMNEKYIVNNRMILTALTGTDGIVVALPGVVDSNSFIKLSFPFCSSDILHTYVFLVLLSSPQNINTYTSVG
jgi:hypothetical protein